MTISALHGANKIVTLFNFKGAFQCEWLLHARVQPKASKHETFHEEIIIERSCRSKMLSQSLGHDNDLISIEPYCP